MSKKEQIRKIGQIFDEVYGNAECSLKYAHPFQLLIATQLAAQCTDARVNIVTKDLFKKYKTIEDFAGADLDILEQDIKSTGFYRNKAKNIKNCCIKLLTNFRGQVPETMEELLTLDGVGRKTANLVLGDVFNKPSIVIDTHAKRLLNRFGITDKQDPTKIEFELMKIIPPEISSKFCHQLVFHGRAVCNARNPKCNICPVSQYCKTGKLEVKSQNTQDEE